MQKKSSYRKEDSVSGSYSLTGCHLDKEDLFMNGLIC